MSEKRYSSNAERQRAYRARKKTPQAPKKMEWVVRDHSKIPDDVKPKSAKCTAYVPHGTKCKLCGKEHK